MGGANAEAVLERGEGGVVSRLRAPLKTERGCGLGEDPAGLGAVETAGRALGSRSCVAAEPPAQPSLLAFRGNSIASFAKRLERGQSTLQEAPEVGSGPPAAGSRPLPRLSV